MYGTLPQLHSCYIYGICRSKEVERGEVFNSSYLGWARGGRGEAIKVGGQILWGELTLLDTMIGSITN